MYCKKYGGVSEPNILYSAIRLSKDRLLQRHDMHSPPLPSPSWVQFIYYNLFITGTVQLVCNTFTYTSRRPSNKTHGGIVIGLCFVCCRKGGVSRCTDIVTVGYTTFYNTCCRYHGTCNDDVELHVDRCYFRLLCLLLNCNVTSICFYGIMRSAALLCAALATHNNREMRWEH